ncbi:MAG: MlaD family protein [Ignavibacteriaceae bacterium]|nr:MlaD family protein [Ignavibacteriaceae bacterium]
MSFKLKNARIIVIVFISLALIAVLASVTTILINERVFEKKLVYRAKFLDATGLKSSNPVFYKGFKIGYVTNYKLSDDNYIYADFYVYEEFKNRIRQNSVLYKNPNFITSVVNINLFVGSNESRQLIEGNLVPAHDVPEGREIQKLFKINYEGDFLVTFLFKFQEVLEELRPTTSEGTENVATIREVIGSFLDVTKKVSSIINNLDTTLQFISVNLRKHGGGVFTTIDQMPELTLQITETSKKAKESLAALDKVLYNYQSPDSLMIKMVDPSGQNLFVPLKNTIMMTNEILPEIQKLAAYSTTQTGNISIILEKIKTVLGEMTQTLENLNNNPLVSGVGGADNSKANPAGGRSRIKNVK